MIKNLLGKAKSVLDEVESTLKSPDSSESKHFNYDETYFTFSLTGGPIHTELLNASAKIRQGTFFSFIYLYNFKVTRLEILSP